MEKLHINKFYWLIVMCLFLLTGCSATYDLYIGDRLTDDIFVFEDNDVLNDLDYYDMYDENDDNLNSLSYQIFSLEKGFNYDRQEIAKDDVSGYRYNYTYSYDRFNEKSMINDCYQEIKISRKDKIVIETSDEFNCFDKYTMLDNVDVNIHYNGVLISTNADNYDNGVYTWNITKDNYLNKKIYLELEISKENHWFEIIGGLVFLVLVIISVAIVYRNKKKNNFDV